MFITTLYLFPSGGIYDSYELFYTSAYLSVRLEEEAGSAVGDAHCVGHSLGAQACAYMGKAMDGDLGRISGKSLSLHFKALMK